MWSYVLDADEVTVVLDDGRHFTAQHVASDPLTEIALLKFDPGRDEVPHFDLPAAATAEPGTRVLAFSNLFGIAVGNEPVSMLHGVFRPSRRSKPVAARSPRTFTATSTWSMLPPTIPAPPAVRSPIRRAGCWACSARS